MATRIMPPSGYLFANEDEVEEIKLGTVEGTVFSKAQNTLRVMMVIDGMEFLKVSRKKGSVDPVHQHDDHDTVAYLVSGECIVHIGDKSFHAKPGAVWQHPRGVPHYTEALTDAVQVEVKSPACKTW